LKLWDLDTAVCVATLEGHLNWVICVAADLASQRALSGSEDKKLKLWDLDRAVCVATLEGHGACVSCVAADFASQ
jgi:WD40 repeat protein